MDEASIIQFITTTFQNVHVATADGNSFFMAGADDKMPFATLVTNDAYDQASNLSRPTIYRLNVGVGRETFRSLFGEAPDPSGAVGYDFTASDQIMPHPVYAAQSWVCVLNPSDDTFHKTVRTLLAEAHDLAIDRQQRRSSKP